MNALKKVKLSKKGFTLAELLIVIAIIAILVAIAIPVFSGQLEKARQAVEMANIRSVKAEATAYGLMPPDGVTLGTEMPFYVLANGDVTTDTPPEGTEYKTYTASFVLDKGAFKSVSVKNANDKTTPKE